MVDELQRKPLTPEAPATPNEIFGDLEVRDRLAHVTTPIMMAHARDDDAIPLGAGRVVAKRIPDARRVRLDRRTHIPLGDEPAVARFAQEARRVLASQRQPPSLTLSRTRRTPPRSPDANATAGGGSG